MIQKYWEEQFAYTVYLKQKMLNKNVRGRSFL